MAERKRIQKSTGGKKTAAKKAPAKKAAPQKSATKEVVSIALIAFGILIIASYYFKACGPVGDFLLTAGLGLFGNAAYALPVLMLIFGVHLVLHRHEKKLYLHKYISGAVIYICACALWHLWDFEYFAGGYSIADAYSMGTLGLGGGVFGSLLCAPLMAGVAKVGTIVILISLILIAFVVMTDFSITRGLASLYRQARGYYDGHMEEREARRQAYKEEDAYITEPQGGIQPLHPTRRKKGYDVFQDVEEDEKPAQKKKKEPAKKEPQDVEEAPPWDEPQEGDDFYDVVEPVINLYSGEELDLGEPEPPAPTPLSQEQQVKPMVEQNHEDNTPIPVEIEEQEEEIPYTYPPIELFSKLDTGDGDSDKPENLRQTAKKLVETLASFGVDAKVLEVSRGPSITRFELQPKAGVKVSKITGLADDIALNLAAAGVRIEAPIPGKAAVGIEIPNKSIATVPLYDVIGSKEFADYPSKLAFALGKDISGAPVIADISKMPHLLIAGATGSGKSVCINALITSILYKASPNEVKLVMVDPKVVELGVYNGIPHLLIPVVTDARKAAGALNWAVQEMTERYKLFAEHNVRNLKGYNQLARQNGWREKEQIVIIIDELADLMMVAPRDVEDAICRLAQLARAAGMHLVIATQRPSVDVITGIIKANIPSRIAFAVSSQVDSRTILDGGGAEKLLGRGDMLFMPVGASKPTRIQGAFIPDQDVEKIVEFVKGDTETKYDEDIIEKIENSDAGGTKEEEAGDNDELLPKAIEVVVEAGQASVSLVQRRLKVGYSRAGRLIDQMEARGIIGPHEGSKPRSILISKQEYYEMSSNYEESQS